jgi:serine/threonine protein kinase
VEDHILKRFDLLEFKGKGAYGIVWKAIDKKTQQTVALKKVFIRYLLTVFRFLMHSIMQRTLREHLERLFF